jgi:ribosomal protein S21
MSKVAYVAVDAYTRSRDENERLIKKFIKKVKKEGILELVRERRYYEKPSTKRKRKKERKKRISRETTKKNNNT